MKFVIEHLKKRYEKKEVLQDIDFTFETGKIYGLLGRNGAGKTTLFNCLNRDIRMDAGSFYLEEEGVRRNVAAEEIGYVLSTPAVPEFLTAREFLKFFLEINEDTIASPQSIDDYFDMMSIIPEDRDKLLKDYSHGMKNKMQMLVNIIAQPKLLLLDEPLTSLDVVVAEEMKQLLRSKEMRHVLYIFFLPQGRYNLFLKVMAIQVAFFHRLQHAMAQEYDFIAQIKGKIHKMRGKDGDPSLL